MISQNKNQTDKVTICANSDNPVIERLRKADAFLWCNPNLNTTPVTTKLGLEDIIRAEKRLEKFAPLLSMLFNDVKTSKGIIESDLVTIPAMQKCLQLNSQEKINGKLWLKADHSLPVAGSIKARGGIYEVLCFAEQLAMEKGLITKNSDYTILAKVAARELFSSYTISVSSTGNLGLSIGIMAAALGFKSSVHMSEEAKQWKKIRLRKRGVLVIEHKDDYSKAVEAGRMAAENDDFSYFVDDENSETLFLGYAVAALRLQRQLLAAKVVVDREHPLFVYIPCGVGGAPGGIAFGLKQLYGATVHCFFAEPTQASCMLLGMANEFQDNLSVYDIGLEVSTEADGLAVSQASELVGTMMKSVLSGIFTVSDKQLFINLYQLKRCQNIKIEPSAAAGFEGPKALFNSDEGRAYLQQHKLSNKMPHANHIIWTTGGLFVPTNEYQKFYACGEALSCD